MNKQIISYSKSEYKSENHPHSCPHCHSQNLKSGAGLQPKQESRRCSDCGKFLGYFPVKELKRARKRSKPGLERISSILARLEFGGEA
jgi:hypothetical protein